MFVLFIVCLVATVFVWVHFGIWWGLLAAFLLLTTPGAAILKGVVAAPFMLAFGRGWPSFVNAWDTCIGDPKRGASDIPDPEVVAMKSAYKVWREANKETGISASGWLAKHAEEFERQGFYSRPKEGEIKVISHWKYDVWSFDETGNWNRAGNRFAATRSFHYANGAWNMTHTEYCGHDHETREAAFPCARALAALSQSQPPAPEDLDPRRAVLVGQGELVTLFGQRFEGIVAIAEHGVLVPWEDAVGMILSWIHIGFFRLRESGERHVLQLQPPAASGVDWMFAEVLEFGARGEEAWVEAMTRKGIARQPEGAPPLVSHHVSVPPLGSDAAAPAPQVQDKP